MSKLKAAATSTACVSDRQLASALAAQRRPWDFGTSLMIFLMTYLHVSRIYNESICTGTLEHRLRSHALCKAHMAEFPCQPHGSALSRVWFLLSHSSTMLRCLEPVELGMTVVDLLTTGPWMVFALLAPKIFYNAAFREWSCMAWLLLPRLAVSLHLTLTGVAPLFFSWYLRHEWHIMPWYLLSMQHRFRWALLCASLFTVQSLALMGLQWHFKGIVPSTSWVLLTLAGFFGASALAYYRDTQFRRSVCVASFSTGQPSSKHQILSNGQLSVIDPPIAAGMASLSQLSRLKVGQLPVADVVTSSTRIQQLLAGGGNGATYQNRTSRMRVYVKIPNAEPRDLKAGFPARVQAQVADSGFQLVNACVRPGCIEMLLEMVALPSKVAGHYNGNSGNTTRTVARVLEALGLNLSDGTELIVHWGDEQCPMIFNGRQWDTQAAAVITAPVATAAASTSEVCAAEADEKDAVPILLSATPILMTARASPMELRSGCGSGSQALPFLHCQLSRPLPPGSVLVASQQGRFLDLIVHGQGQHLRIDVRGCCCSELGLVRIELRLLSGAISGICNILIVPSEAIREELEQLEEDLDAATAAYIEEGQTAASWARLQAINATVLDLGHWFEYCAAASVLVAAEQDCACPTNLNLLPALTRLSREPEYAALMVQVALDLLALAVQCSWPNLAEYILQGLASNGTNVGEALKSMSECRGGMTVLHLAVTSGSISMVELAQRFAVRYGHATVGTWASQTSEGYTPAHLAAMLQDGGALARHLLLNSRAARAAWWKTGDQLGVTPAALAAAVNKQHLNNVATQRAVVMHLLRRPFARGTLLHSCIYGFADSAQESRYVQYVGLKTWWTSVCTVMGLFGFIFFFFWRVLLNYGLGPIWPNIIYVDGALIAVWYMWKRPEVYLRHRERFWLLSACFRSAAKIAMAAGLIYQKPGLYHEAVEFWAQYKDVYMESIMAGLAEQVRVHRAGPMYLLDLVTTIILYEACGLHTDWRWTVLRALVRNTVTFGMLAVRDWRDRQQFLQLPAERSCTGKSKALKVQ